MDVSVEIKNKAYILGEGPHWEEKSQNLLFVDIKAHEIHKWNPLTKEEGILKLSDTVGFVVPTQSGKYATGLGRNLATFDWNDPSDIKIHTEIDQGLTTKFNDGKCDASGRLWAGTMGHEPERLNFDIEKASLYSFDQSGNAKKHLDKISISNGLAWSADNQTMFYIDSVPKKIYAFDFDIITGSLNNQRVLRTFDDNHGFPDGMTIDVNGNLWIAEFGSGKVTCIDPETGNDLQSIEFPGAKQITSCCFGGKHYDELYVTTAYLDLTDQEKKDQPNAGAVFKVTGLGVKGLAAHNYNIEV